MFWLLQNCPLSDKHDCESCVTQNVPFYSELHESPSNWGLHAGSPSYEQLNPSLDQQYIPFNENDLS